MINMATWPSQKLNVTKDLRLDPKNVRLERTAQDAAQGDIIRDLFLNEGAMDLARAIATVGWLTHELPVVIKENNYWIVVEGNRRVSALKALHNPQLVPASQSQLADLAAQNPNLKNLIEISVIVAPDRMHADELIATLHTANPRRPWSPLRQADFFYAQIESGGTTFDALQKRYPTVNIPKFILMAEMHKLLKTVKYDDSEIATYVNRKNFPISVYARLYMNDKVLKLAKLRVDQTTGQVTSHGKPEDFSKLATKIVSDIKSKKIDTRVLNTPDSPSYIKYYDELSKFEVRDDGKSVAVIGAPIVPINPFPQRKPRLDTSAIAPLAGYPTIERILDELGRLPYRDFPNATFDLIRTFMEKSIKAYADSLGETIAPRLKGQFVYLDDALLWLQEQVVISGPKSLIQPINRLRSKKNFNNFQLTKEFLDAANHNHEIFATPDEVKDLWDSISGILKYYLKK